MIFRDNLVITPNMHFKHSQTNFVHFHMFMLTAQRVTTQWSLGILQLGNAPCCSPLNSFWLQWFMIKADNCHHFGPFNRKKSDPSSVQNEGMDHQNEGIMYHSIFHENPSICIPMPCARPAAFSPPLRTWCFDRAKAL